jgi:hypothetical protein
MIKRILVAIALLTIPLCPALGGQTRTGTLKGRIENAKGKPIAGAEVRVLRTRDRSVRETRTDQNGNYSFELEPDDYTVSFDAEGYRGGNLIQMQQVEAGEETVVKTIKLEKGKRSSLIRGAVFDERGTSLAGVRVKLTRVPSDEESRGGKKVKSVHLEYISNSRGEFAFRLPPERGRYELTALLNGYKADTKVVDVSEDEAAAVAFSLEPVKKKPENPK